MNYGHHNYRLDDKGHAIIIAKLEAAIASLRNESVSPYYRAETAAESIWDALVAITNTDWQPSED